MKDGYLFASGDDGRLDKTSCVCQPETMSMSSVAAASAARPLTTRARRRRALSRRPARQLSFNVDARGDNVRDAILPTASPSPRPTFNARRGFDDRGLRRISTAAWPEVRSRFARGNYGDDGDGEVPLSWYPPGLREWEAEVKEGSRKYRRTSFTPERWAAHRSVGRYWRHLAGIPTSRVVQGLLAPCAFTAAVAFVACAGRPYYTGVFDVTSPTPFSLTAACLGLMLVFRTNESYARFVRAHDAWSSLMSRAIEARYITLNSCEDRELRDLMGRYLLAYVIALKERYRCGSVDSRASDDTEASPNSAKTRDGAQREMLVATEKLEQLEEEEEAQLTRMAGTVSTGLRLSPDLARVLRPSEAADMARRRDQSGHALHVLYGAVKRLGDQEGVRMPTLGRLMAGSGAVDLPLESRKMPVTYEWGSCLLCRLAHAHALPVVRTRAEPITPPAFVANIRRLLIV